MTLRKKLGFLIGGAVGLLLLATIGLNCWNARKVHSKLEAYLADSQSTMTFVSQRDSALPLPLSNHTGTLSATGWAHVRAAMLDSQPTSLYNVGKPLAILKPPPFAGQITLYSGNVFTVQHSIFCGTPGNEVAATLKNYDALEDKTLQCNQDLLAILETQLLAEHPDWR